MRQEVMSAETCCKAKAVLIICILAVAEARHVQQNVRLNASILPEYSAPVQMQAKRNTEQIDARILERKTQERAKLFPLMEAENISVSNVVNSLTDILFERSRKASFQQYADLGGTSLGKKPSDQSIRSDEETVLPKHDPEAGLLPRTSCILPDVESAGCWCAATAVALSSAINAALCMTFSAVEEPAQELLKIGPGRVADLYTIWMVATLIGNGFAMYGADKHEKAALYLCLLLTVAAAWVRFIGLAADFAPYLTAILSEVLCGVGAGPIFTLPGQVSHRRFPKREQPLATSFMLQANYLGWLLGVTLPPLAVHDVHALKVMVGIQACIATVVGLIAILLYRPMRNTQKSKAVSFESANIAASWVKDSGNTAEPWVEDSDVAISSSSGVMQVIRCIHSHPRFGMQLATHGILGGISFAAPSAMCFILDAHGLSSNVVAGANAAFIATGVVAGLLLGFCCKKPRYFGPVLKVCYGACALSLGGFALQAKLYELKSHVTILILLCAAAGATSLGFVGIGIEAASLYPVKAGNVCWAVESMILACAAVLNHCASTESGYWSLTVASAVCALPILSLYKKPPEHKRLE